MGHHEVKDPVSPRFRKRKEPHTWSWLDRSRWQKPLHLGVLRLLQLGNHNRCSTFRLDRFTQEFVLNKKSFKTEGMERPDRI